MKKTNKLLVGLCIIVAVALISVSSFAEGMINPTSFQPSALTPTQTSGILNIGGTIISVVRTVGALVAVVILLVLGIKYMVASAEEKADYKKSMIPYIVGAILIFGASAIAGIVYDMAMSLNPTNN